MQSFCLIGCFLLLENVKDGHLLCALCFSCYLAVSSKFYHNKSPVTVQYLKRVFLKYTGIEGAQHIFVRYAVFPAPHNKAGRYGTAGTNSEQLYQVTGQALPPAITVGAALRIEFAKAAEETAYV